MVEARGEAENGGEIVAKAIEAMDNVARASAEISDITSLIDGIAFQTNLLALHAGVEAVTSHVQAGVALVHDIWATLETIISRVGTVTTSISSIAETASEQSVALRQIIQAIGGFDQMTRQNAPMVEQTHAATRNLSQEAGQLASAFSSFRISKESAPPRRKPANPALKVVGNLAVKDDWSEF